MKILFVCTGNVCRSALAEGYFKTLLKQNNIEGIEAASKIEGRSRLSLTETLRCQNIKAVAITPLAEDQR